MSSTRRGATKTANDKRLFVISEAQVVAAQSLMGLTTKVIGSCSCNCFDIGLIVKDSLL